MESDSIRVLLVEDNYEYAQIMREILAQAGVIHYDVVHCTTIGAAVKALIESPVHLILLDLFLPDCAGYEAFARIHDQAPEAPIVVLTAREDEVLAVRSVRHGAQDYLVKGQVNHKVLLRSIRYAVERQRGQARIQRLTMIDDLTGLFNRRGFLSYGRKYIKLSQRTKKGVMVLFVDMDGLKVINDKLGHNMGDQALVDIADALRTTFRDSDIIGRIGGDEFAILAMDVIATNGNAGLLTSRLLQHLEACNGQPDRPYLLSLSVGTAFSRPEETRSLEELLEEADGRMYEQKRTKKTGALRSPA
jgi:diguanylate cyclase (GGDEF)-like protein